MHLLYHPRPPLAVANAFDLDLDRPSHQMDTRPRRNTPPPSRKRSRVNPPTPPVTSPPDAANDIASEVRLFFFSYFDHGEKLVLT